MLEECSGTTDQDEEGPLKEDVQLEYWGGRLRARFDVIHGQVNVEEQEEGAKAANGRLHSKLEERSEQYQGESLVHLLPQHRARSD